MANKNKIHTIDEQLLGDDDIVELFKRHCECRPVNISRLSHSHDCDTLYTDTCRIAIFGKTEEARETARQMIVDFINDDQ